jgi:HAD superfamily hydrolase (TIGR01549 family)
MLRAVLFDWDGTLVDTLSHMFAATEIVMAEFHRPITFADYRCHFTPDWKLLYRRFGVPEEIVEPMGARWWTVYRGQDDAPLLPGAAEALQRLAEAGIALGIVTGGYRFNVGPQLERHGVADLLPVRVYGDDLPFTKPNPELLFAALGQMGLRERPAETAYLGDALDDVRMADAAGVHAVGVTSILGTEAELRAAGAVDVAASVHAWVDALLASKV